MEQLLKCLFAAVSCRRAAAYFGVVSGASEKTESLASLLCYSWYWARWASFRWFGGVDGCRMGSNFVGGKKAQ